MKLTTQNFNLSNPTLTQVEEQLNKLNRQLNTFVILENSENSYVQCAGNSHRLTVEYREHSQSNFKHFVIGKGENKSPLRTTWVILPTGVGSLQIHQEEILSMEEASLIFKAFLLKLPLPDGLKKRNVTKLHKK